MGHEAAVTKSAVIRKVHACIDLVNANDARVTEAAEKHNIFVRQVDADIKDLQVARTAHAQWCRQNEDAARKLTQMAEKTDERIGLVDGRAMLLRADVHAYVNGLARLTFWQRLRWLFTGAMPITPAFSVWLFDHCEEEVQSQPISGPIRESSAA